MPRKFQPDDLRTVLDIFEDVFLQDVTEASTFKSLDADDLDRIELACEIEEEFCIGLTDDDIEKQMTASTTAGEFIAYVKGRVEK